MNNFDLCNNNLLNEPSEENYRKFNEFIFSNDLKLIGKLLHRFKFFLQTKHLPGDIVEVGVFKGSGVATFIKFLEIFCPNSNKKVIGFDLFDTQEASFILNSKDSNIDKITMTTEYCKVDQAELCLNKVEENLYKISDKSNNKIKLIKGDIENSVPKFIQENPGFRTSLIYMDVDIARPTYHALINLWDRLLPGGIILFDEYEHHIFSESLGTEKFLKDKNLEYNILTTDWIAPTAYIVKTK